MRASNFKRFLKTIPKQIKAFTREADEKDGDEQWEHPTERYCASKILIWIIRKTKGDLSNNQIVRAWRSIVKECWSMEDFHTYNERNNIAVLGETKWRLSQDQGH